jgi:hypothetical protein
MIVATRLIFGIGEGCRRQGRRRIVAPAFYRTRDYLEPELAVRGLPAALAVFACTFVLKLERCCCTELVYVAAGQARTVRAVPVLFEQH